ncbi:hypothetical protein OsI_38951 [Oryza sativa Indica Group]|uniref:Uncharacterized protein n=1 Tax=Oryza sativa subsp. indica TaxID=39946 RepID=B8BMT0_ORYSI|nr:hypothetical protein OsI_38951 [Oryza sativa Indica Group]
MAHATLPRDFETKAQSLPENQHPLTVEVDSGGLELLFSDRRTKEPIVKAYQYCLLSLIFNLLATMAVYDKLGMEVPSDVVQIEAYHANTSVMSGDQGTGLSQAGTDAGALQSENNIQHEENAQPNENIQPENIVEECA